MAFNSPGEPFSVPDPLADDWDDMVRRNRLLQAQNDPLSFGEADDAGPPDPVADALNDASLSYADWLALRAQQLAGDTTTPNGGAQLFASTPAGVAAAAGARGPLTGRPGTAAMVAGALNTIAGGANTSAPIDIKGRVDGTISRGSGQDVRAQGKVRLPLLGPIPVDARGTLDPPAPGKAEVSVSNINGKGVGLPRARFYNTPSGELDVDLSGDLKFGGVTIRKRGTYVVQ
jgi:hypothetical protein